MTKNNKIMKINEKLLIRSNVLDIIINFILNFKLNNNGNI